MSATLGELIDHHGIDVFAYLDRDLEVPVLDGIQIQGDLAVIPSASASPGGTVVPPDGIPVIPAVGGGHEHRLLAGGPPRSARWKPAEGRGTDLGILTCTGPAYLAHPEHGYLGIAPGTYLLRRQREHREAVRTVID
jgi:hypothetical protein